MRPLLILSMIFFCSAMAWGQNCDKIYDDLKKEEKKLEALQKKYDQLKTDFDNKEKENQNLKKAAKAQVKKIDELKATNASLTASLKEKDQIIAQSNSSKASEASKFNNLQEEHNKLLIKLNNLEKDTIGLAKMKKEANTLNALKSDLATAQKTIQDRDQKITNITQSKNKEISDLTTQKKALELQLKDQKEKYGILQKNLVQVNNEVDSKNKEITNQNNEIARLEGKVNEMTPLKERNIKLQEGLLLDRQTAVNEIVASRSYSASLKKAKTSRASLEEAKANLELDAFDGLINKLANYEKFAGLITKCQGAMSTLFNAGKINGLVRELSSTPTGSLTPQQRTDVTSYKNALNNYCGKHSIAKEAVEKAISMGSATKVAARFLNEALPKVKGYPYLEGEIKKMLNNMSHRSKSGITKVSCR